MLNLLRKIVRRKLVSVVSGSVSLILVLVLAVSGLLVRNVAAILVSSAVIHSDDNSLRWKVWQISKIEFRSFRFLFELLWFGLRFDLSKLFFRTLRRSGRLCFSRTDFDRRQIVFVGRSWFFASVRSSRLFLLFSDFRFRRRSVGYFRFGVFRRFLFGRFGMLRRFSSDRFPVFRFPLLGLRAGIFNRNFRWKVKIIKIFILATKI